MNPSNIFTHAFKFLVILLFLFVRPLWRTNAINEQGRVILVKNVNADLFCFAFIQNSDSVIKKFLFTGGTSDKIKEENFCFQTRNSVIPKRRIFKTFSTTYIKN